MKRLVPLAAALAVACLAAAGCDSPATAASTDSMANADATSVLADTVTTGRIKAAIAADPGMKDTDVSVSTTGGVATLSGTVKSQDQVTISSNLAQRQEGVVKVETNLTVK